MTTSPLTRRNALRGLLWVAAAPAIVRATSLMPIRTIEPWLYVQVSFTPLGGNKIFTIDEINRELWKLWKESLDRFEADVAKDIMEIVS